MAKEGYKATDLTLYFKGWKAAIFLVIITTIYVSIKWFSPNPDFWIYNLMPFKCFADYPTAEPSYFVDWISVAASITVLFFVILLLYRLYEAGKYFYWKIFTKRLDEMHKGWSRVHKILCFLFCCYTLNHFVFSDPHQMNKGFFEIIVMVGMGSVIYVITPYCIILYLFLWIKDGFNSKK